MSSMTRDAKDRHENQSDPNPKDRLFSEGIGDALYVARSMTASDLSMDFQKLVSASLKRMRDEGFILEFDEAEALTPHQKLCIIGHESQRFILSLDPEKSDKLEGDADVLVAIALVRDTIDRLEAGAVPLTADSLACVVYAARVLGSCEVFKAMVDTGLTDKAASFEVRKELQKRYGQRSGEVRAAPAKEWQAKAWKAYQSHCEGRKRPLSPESWAKSNTKDYGVRPDYLAKVIRKLKKKNRT